MSTRKTKVDYKLVFKFLTSNFAPGINSLFAIQEGESSQAFFFSCKDGDFVIRVNSKKLGFEKDKYAYDHFRTERIPIPKTFQIGRLNDTLYYSITERATGKSSNHFRRVEILRFMPELFNVLDSIHNFNIGENQFGYWTTDGKAFEATWKEFLLKQIEDYDDDQRETAAGVLVEQNVVQPTLARYLQLIDCCPNIRHLIHGDFGFSNLYSDGKTVTGVIDWENSKYGDFLYDIAYLSFWAFTIDYAELFLKRCQDKKLSVPMFRERILCYKLLIGLRALRSFSRFGQESAYNRVKQRLIELL